jgi:hypothetical protein
MNENQKLREVLQHAIEDLSSATGFLTRRSRDRQSKTVAALAQLQADIALPTAVPVCEREAFERTMMDKFGWERKDFKLDDFGYFDGHTATAWMAWQARAALSAGDAGWQPIETAPKDGSDCWLLVDGDVRRGFWVEIEFEERRDMDGRYIDQTDADAYWMDHDSGDSLEPTMFYPITKPLPPSLVDIDAAMRKDKP